MAVVQVGSVGVFVYVAFVTMEMTVLSCCRGVVKVMPVVVTMQMLVLDRLVTVAMPVHFGQVEHHAAGEQECCDESCSVRRSVAQNACGRRSNEGGQREYGSSPRRSDSPLRQQVEAQTQAVARGTT
jgi:hypothetical protein